MHPTRSRTRRGAANRRGNDRRHGDGQGRGARPAMIRQSTSSKAVGAAGSSSRTPPRLRARTRGRARSVREEPGRTTRVQPTNLARPRGSTHLRIRTLGYPNPKLRWNIRSHDPTRRPPGPDGRVSPDGPQYGNGRPEGVRKSTGGCGRGETGRLTILIRVMATSSWSIPTSGAVAAVRSKGITCYFDTHPAAPNPSPTANNPGIPHSGRNPAHPPPDTPPPRDPNIDRVVISPRNTTKPRPPPPQLATRRPWLPDP